MWYVLHIVQLLSGDSMKRKCIFTVVTIVYNDVAHIERTIKSVLGQQYPHIDYVVIDGASTDGTVDILERYRERLSTFVSEKDSGIYNAMNKGLSHTKGDYVIFMNSGDCFSSPTILKEVEEAIAHCNEKPLLVYGNYRESTDEGCGKPIPARSHKKAWYGAFASHQSMFYNVDFLRREHLQYDERYRIAADYKLNLVVATKVGDRVLLLPLCISDFDVTGVSNINQNRGMMEADRARKEVLGMSLVRRRAILGVQLFARWTKKYLSPLYKVVRRRI